MQQNTVRIGIGYGTPTAQTTPVLVASNDEINAKESTATIYLLDDDPVFLGATHAQLQQYGYDVKCFGSTQEFSAAIEKKLPDLIISDIELQEETSTEFFIRENYVDKFLGTPIIYLSGYNDFHHRLEAARTGASAFFHKPVDINALTERIDIVTHRQKEEAIRVLLVDDSRSQSALISYVLGKHNMQVDCINRPETTLDYLDEHRPDIIILDINMPVCSGIELATVIRQLDTYVSIPIVYLSTESAIDKQLEAKKVGGDDFLTKPINHDTLVSTVTSRVRRSRSLQSLMMRDSLTGLYNHTTTKEKLSNEINRSQRAKNQLVFGMIDIDKFKSVNDTYGHPTGDKVIKSLARLLRQRLRTTDIVGRYGGEEFAFALLDTDMNNAIRIMNEIRESFSQIVHTSEGRHFNSTFSCGLASFPDFDSVVSLNDAADKALYMAKNNGRNQVVAHK
ncbi:MAG: diguanylate cyclase [Gammaproteobacteria bacterium]|nr:diguanylate cyclase [Gammaproteobacteria bacterium]